MRRRQFFAAAALPLASCRPPEPIGGGFNGVDHARGHLLREARALGAPSVTRHVDVVIAGAGVAGLAAARALRMRGIEDFAVLELEDEAGGNSRATTMGSMQCPMGAHYLPLPGNAAHEVQDLLEEFGLRRRVAGRWEYDERYLCHSPQERLFFNGVWQEGLLPMLGVGAATIAQYTRFADLVDQARRESTWAIPSTRHRLSVQQLAWVTSSFQDYLDQHGLTDPHLRWYLDYCCRDDYGAGSATVSAWAGLHYFASRHGFLVPGVAETERDAVLTWPEGNAWLTRKLAEPLLGASGGRMHATRVVTRISVARHGVVVDAFDARTRMLERWQALHCIVALPIHVASRVVEQPPGFMRTAAASVRYAAWLVANIELTKPLYDRPGAPPSWDNVIHGDSITAPGLGYVDAMHQSMRPVPGATVMSYYRALGDLSQGRQMLLDRPWQSWCDSIITELSVPHPDLRAKARRIDVTRYGHAMAIPVARGTHDGSGHGPWLVPGRAATSESRALADGRLSFAHSDWAGYSIFEEAFTLGHAAGMNLRL